MNKLQACTATGTLACMNVIGTPLQAHELHTAYYQWRLAHPTQDRLLHHGHWVANQEDSSPLSVHDLTAFGSSEAYHNISRVLDDVIISRADTVFLSDEIRNLVMTAEATMPDEVLFRTDLFTPCGFVVMETGIERRIGARVLYDEIDDLVKQCMKYGATITGERKYSGVSGEPIDCMEVWSVQGFAWGDAEAVAHDTVSLIRSEFGEESEAHLIASHIHQDAKMPLHVRVYGSLVCSEMDGLTVTVPAMNNAPLHLIDRYGFLYGEDGASMDTVPMPTDDEANEMDTNAYDRQKETRRFIVALLRLMEEYIEVDKCKTPRSFSRRADRAGRSGDTANISLLALRRSLYGDAEEGTGRKVTLAHLVRGHWRNQWYPSQNTHRYKWINAHRRGGHKDDEVTERPRVITVTK